jgi:hypothetical protein
VKIKCEVCKIEGYLQQLGNYFRVRHYAGIGANGKSKFYYHQQSKDYALSQIAINRKGENFIEEPSDIVKNETECLGIEQLTIGQELNLKDSSLISSGRRLAGLGHKPSKLAIPGSNPGDRTFMLYRDYMTPEIQSGLLPLSIIPESNSVAKP